VWAENLCDVVVRNADAPPTRPPTLQRSFVRQQGNTRPEPIFEMTRDEIVGQPTFTKCSDLGVVQCEHGYDPILLGEIARKASALRHSDAAAKRHLNLKFVRAAHHRIPEIGELINDSRRLERLSTIAGTRLEAYPLSVVSSIITFQGADEAEGSVVWHTDGVPVTELIPLVIDDTLGGGELEIFKGSSETGLARQVANDRFDDDEIIRIIHRKGYSIVAQFIRVMHRVAPISRGSRITLNLNLRSHERPHIDDTSMCFLAADNPEREWEAEYIRDVRKRQLPQYLRERA
jgi:hypothetical protein